MGEITNHYSSHTYLPILETSKHTVHHHFQVLHKHTPMQHTKGTDKEIHPVEPLYKGQVGSRSFVSCRVGCPLLRGDKCTIAMGL